MTPPPAGVIDDSSTCACVAPIGAAPATLIRCQLADAVSVVSDHVTDSSALLLSSQRIPIRSGTVAPDASANAKYTVPARTGYDETVRTCISPAATLVRRRQPSPFRPPPPLASVQFNFVVHPDVFGSMDSVVAERKFPGIAKGSSSTRGDDGDQLLLLLMHDGFRLAADLAEELAGVEREVALEAHRSGRPAGGQRCQRIGLRGGEHRLRPASPVVREVHARLGVAAGGVGHRPEAVPGSEPAG